MAPTGSQKNGESDVQFITDGGVFDVFLETCGRVWERQQELQLDKDSLITFFGSCYRYALIQTMRKLAVASEREESLEHFQATSAKYDEFGVFYLIEEGIYERTLVGDADEFRNPEDIIMERETLRVGPELIEAEIATMFAGSVEEQLEATIFRLAQEGMSLVQIAQELKTQGGFDCHQVVRLTRNPFGTPFSTQKVRELLVHVSQRLMNCLREAGLVDFAYQFSFAKAANSRKPISGFDELPKDLLTLREQEILALLEEGMTDKAAAQRLGITHGGVRAAKSRIRTKQANPVTAYMMEREQMITESLDGRWSALTPRQQAVAAGYWRLDDLRAFAQPPTRDVVRSGLLASGQYQEDELTPGKVSGDLMGIRRKLSLPQMKDFSKPVSAS